MSNRTHSKQNFRFKIINGAAAGNLTVTGIAVTDVLEFVTAGAFTIDSAAPADDDPIDLTASAGDLTSEFTISAANTINNTGGTTTAANVVFVGYWETA